MFLDHQTFGDNADMQNRLGGLRRVATLPSREQDQAHRAVVNAIVVVNDKDGRNYAVSVGADRALLVWKVGMGWIGLV